MQKCNESIAIEESGFEDSQTSSFYLEARNEDLKMATKKGVELRARSKGDEAEPAAATLFELRQVSTFLEAQMSGSADALRS